MGMAQTSCEPALRAVSQLARILIEAGALSQSDVVIAAARVEREGLEGGADEKTGYDIAAHWLRCAVLDTMVPEPVTRLGVIDGGKP